MVGGDLEEVDARDSGTTRPGRARGTRGPRPGSGKFAIMTYSHPLSRRTHRTRRTLRRRRHHPRRPPPPLQTPAPATSRALGARCPIDCQAFPLRYAGQGREPEQGDGEHARLDSPFHWSRLWSLVRPFPPRPAGADREYSGPRQV